MFTVLASSPVARPAATKPHRLSLVVGKRSLFGGDCNSFDRPLELNFLFFGECDITFETVVRTASVFKVASPLVCVVANLWYDLGAQAPRGTR